MKNLFLIILFLLKSQINIGQIIGNVRDYDSHEPISQVSVCIVDTNTYRIVGGELYDHCSTTATDGRFLLNSNVQESSNLLFCASINGNRWYYEIAIKGFQTTESLTDLGNIYLIKSLEKRTIKRRFGKTQEYWEEFSFNEGNRFNNESFGQRNYKIYVHWCLNKTNIFYPLENIYILKYSEFETCK